MDVRREPHLRGQRDTVPGKRDAIRLRNRELEVGCFEAVRDFFAKLRKEFNNHVVPGKPLAVLRFEELFSNHATSVDKEISRASHALELTRGLDVENLVGANDPGIGIGEQGKIDFAAIREVFQYRFVIIADPGESDSLLFKPCFGVLQLNQLSFAVRSPIRGTEEEENRAVRCLQTFQCLLSPKLVAS